MRQTRPVAKKTTRVSLDDEIAHLRDLDLHGLRARWKSVFRRQAPPHLPRHLLFAVLAYRLQADELGDLDPATARLLRLIATGGETRGASRRTEEFGRRRTELKPGTILMREWNAQAHRVMVVDEGFAWNGKTYDSLSKVAFAITGTNWNGPRFFGLRDKIAARDHVMTASRLDDRSAAPSIPACRPSAGLDQDFNSLDAQYDAAQAYIRSQAHAGWTLVRTRYDDGGFSGGSTDRPALQQLLDDIRAPPDQCHCRLQGRSPDPLFGRFRQAGRAVRCPWRVVRLGYPAVQHHDLDGATHPQRLAVLCPVRAGGHLRAHPRQDRRPPNARAFGSAAWSPWATRPRIERSPSLRDEAKTVRHIFRRYLDLGSLNLLLTDLRRTGVKTKLRPLSNGRTIGGIPFTRGSLAAFLRNRFYIGEVRYKGEVFPGEQPAILDRALFEAVQTKLDQQRTNHAKARQKSQSLLMGRIFDDRGNRMTPSHAVKNGVRYRYYISAALIQGQPDKAAKLNRVPATEIEKLILSAVRKHLTGKPHTKADAEGPGLTQRQGVDLRPCRPC